MNRFRSATVGRLPLLLALVAAVALAGCVSKSKYNAEVEERSREIERLKGDAKLRDQYVGELTNTWTEVEDAISKVETEQRKVEALLTQTEGKGPVSQTRRDELLSKVADIEATLKHYRQKLADLEKKLAAEKGENAKLRELVSKLNGTIAKKEGEIKELRTEVEGLKTTVARLEVEGQEKDKVIGEQHEVIQTRTSEVEAARRELDKAFWVFGTAKDLKAKGVVVASGGFIGLGKSLKLAGNLDPNDFEQIEKSTKTEFAIPAPLKKIAFVSQHAVGSYELVVVSPKLTTLKVVNSDEFWKLGKYLVIEVE